MSLNNNNNRLRFGEPQDLVPEYKTYPYQNSCSTKLDASNPTCYPQYRPRDYARCGFRMHNRHYNPKRNNDHSWKYGYLEHRLSSFGPKNVWINGMGEVIVYGPKEDLPESVKQYEWTNDPQLPNQSNIPEYQLQNRSMQSVLPRQSICPGIQIQPTNTKSQKYQPFSSNQTKKENFGFGYGSGNIDSVNRPEELNYSCGWKAYGYYT